MPSSSSGRSKLDRAVYNPGSGGMNVNPSDQDEPYVDQLEEQRWAIFRHEYRGDLDLVKMREAFNQKFGYGT